MVYNPYKDLNKIPDDIEEMAKKAKGWFEKSVVQEVVAGKPSLPAGSGEIVMDEIEIRQPNSQTAESRFAPGQPSEAGKVPPLYGQSMKLGPTPQDIRNEGQDAWMEFLANNPSPTGTNPSVPSVSPLEVATDFRGDPNDAVSWNVPRGYPPGDAYHAVKDWMTSSEAPATVPGAMDFMKPQGPINAAAQAPNVVINVAGGDHDFDKDPLDVHLDSRPRGRKPKYANIIEQALAEGIPTAAYQQARATPPKVAGADYDFSGDPLDVHLDKTPRGRKPEYANIIEEAQAVGIPTAQYQLERAAESALNPALIETVKGKRKEIQDAIADTGEMSIEEDAYEKQFPETPEMSPLMKKEKGLLSYDHIASPYAKEGDLDALKQAALNDVFGDEHQGAGRRVGQGLLDLLPSYDSKEGWNYSHQDKPDEPTLSERLHPVNLPPSTPKDELIRYKKVYDAAFGPADENRKRIQGNELNRISNIPGIMRSELPALALGQGAGAVLTKVMKPLFQVVKGIKLPKIVSLDQLRKVDDMLLPATKGANKGFGAAKPLGDRTVERTYQQAYGLTPEEMATPGYLEAAISAERARLLAGKPRGVGLTEKELFRVGEKTFGDRLTEGLGATWASATDLFAPDSVSAEDALHGHGAHSYSPYETEKAYDQRLVDILTEKQERLMSADPTAPPKYVSYPVTDGGMVSEYPVEIEEEAKVTVRDRGPEEVVEEEEVEVAPKTRSKYKGTVYEDRPRGTVKPRGKQITPTEDTGRMRLANAVSESMGSDNYFEKMYTFLKDNQESGLVGMGLSDKDLRGIAHNTGVKWYNWFIDKQSRQLEKDRSSWDKQIYEMNKSANKALIDEIEAKRRRGEKLEDDEKKFHRDIYIQKMRLKGKKRTEKDYSDFLSQWSQNPSAHISDIAMWTARDTGMANFLANMARVRSEAKSASGKQLNRQMKRIHTVMAYNDAVEEGRDNEADRIVTEEMDDLTITPATKVEVLEQELKKYRDTALNIAARREFGKTMNYDSALKLAQASISEVIMKSDDPDVLDLLTRDKEARDLIVRLIEDPKGHNLSKSTFYPRTTQRKKKGKKRY